MITTLTNLTIPSATELLRVWEEQQGAHPVRQVLAALGAASPDRDPHAWEAATVGARDRGLLDLHEHLFGSGLSTVATCPNCGAQLESDFSADDIRGRAEGVATSAPLRIERDGYTIDYRLPTSADLLALGSAADADDAERRLLLRCIRGVERAGAGARGDAVLDGVDGVEGVDGVDGVDVMDLAMLPDEWVASVSADMARHDPDADVPIAFECPGCGVAWQTRFDIVTYFWAELDDWALRLLADVHALAQAYGWSERAILELSPTRREIYLDMVRG